MVAIHYALEMRLSMNSRQMFKQRIRKLLNVILRPVSCYRPSSSIRNVIRGQGGVAISGEASRSRQIIGLNTWWNFARPHMPLGLRKLITTLWNLTCPCEFASELYNRLHVADLLAMVFVSASKFPISGLELRVPSDAAEN